MSNAKPMAQYELEFARLRERTARWEANGREPLEEEAIKAETMRLENEVLADLSELSGYEALPVKVVNVRRLAYDESLPLQPGMCAFHDASEIHFVYVETIDRGRATVRVLPEPFFGTQDIHERQRRLHEGHRGMICLRDRRQRDGKPVPDAFHEMIASYAESLASLDAKIEKAAGSAE